MTMVNVLSYQGVRLNSKININLKTTKYYTVNDKSHILQELFIKISNIDFRKRRSCESQLIITIDRIAKYLSNGTQIDIILLDFEKAFDKVPHSRLLYKLQFYGVGGRTNSWISSFLSNRKQQVVLEGARSQQDDVLSGVP